MSAYGMGYPPPTVGVPSRPAGLPLLAVALGCGAAGLASTIAYIVLVISGLQHAGPRAVAETGAGLGPLTALYVLVGCLLWIASVTLTIVHLVAHGRFWRAAAADPAQKPRRSRRTTLLAVTWVFVGLDPIIAAVVLVIVLAGWTFVGVACGEAASSDCGM